MYGFPLIMMLIGLCLSYMVFAKDNTLIATITAFVCMAVSFLIIRLNEDKIKSSTKFLPSISRKVSDDLMPLL
jgi:positive regulator of sigma E, rseC/mucC